MKQLGRAAFPHAAERAYRRAIIRRLRVVHALTLKVLEGADVVRTDANTDPPAKRSARRRVQTLIENGTLKPPGQCKCADCGEKASEYDHTRGYSKPESVAPVCASCHHKRTNRRADAINAPIAIGLVLNTEERVELTIPVPTADVVRAGRTVDFAVTSKVKKDLAKIRGVPAVSIRDEFTPIQWSSWINDNVGLIKSIDRRYFNEVADVVGRAADGAWSIPDMRAEIQDRFKVSKARAAVIARDQIGKLHSQIDRARHTEAGITHFIWRTSQDQRVRDEHQNLEGRVFSYAEGAPKEGLPGQPIQCRCTAEPVIDVDMIEDVGAEMPAPVPTPALAGVGTPLPFSPLGTKSEIVELESLLSSMDDDVKRTIAARLPYRQSGRDEQGLIDYYSAEERFELVKMARADLMAARLLSERDYRFRNPKKAPAEPENALQAMLNRAKGIKEIQSSEGFPSRLPPDGTVEEHNAKVMAAKEAAELHRLAAKHRAEQRRLAEQIKDWADREYKENTKTAQFQKSTGFSDDHLGGGATFGRKEIGTLNKNRRIRKIEGFRTAISERQDVLAALRMIPADEYTEEYIERMTGSEDLLNEVKRAIPRPPDPTS